MATIDDYKIYKKEFNLRGIWTEQQAEDLFNSVLANKGLKDKFSSLFSTSDQSLMKELTKAFSVVLTHILEDKRDSMWLSMVKDVQQAYDIVRFYDYSIYRHKAPRITIRYMGNTTKVLRLGDVIGTYKGYDIVCTDSILYMEYNDLKTFSLGKFVEAYADVNVDEIGDSRVLLTPTYLSSIDQDNVHVFAVNGLEVPITKNIVRYVGETHVRDFSLDNNSTEIFLRNDIKQFGVPNVFDSVTKKCTLKYLETDGVLSTDATFTLSVTDLTLNEEYTGIVPTAYVDYLGYNGDTLLSLQRHAPLVSTTGGYAHSLEDYKILTSSLPEFYTTNAYKDRGGGEKRKYTITNSLNVCSITIDSTVYPFNSGLDNLYALQVALANDTEGYYLDVIDGNSFFLKTVQFGLAYTVTGLVNITETFIAPSIAPTCCSVMIPFIRQQYYDGVSSVKQLSRTEKILVTTQSDKFKSWGAECVYYPATEKTIDLTLTVVRDSRVQNYNQLDTQIKELVKTYSYNVGEKINIQEIVARVSQIEYTDNDYNTFSGVNTCQANTAIRDRIYIPQNDEYYVINLVINYKEW